MTRFTQEAGASAGLSHPNIHCRRLRRRLRGRYAPSGHGEGHGSAIRGDRTSIEVPLGYNPPDGKTGELVAELVNDPNTQLRRAVDGFRQIMKRGGLVGADRAYRTCGPAHVAAAILSNPVTRAVRQLTRFSWSDGTNTASLELLASQMRRVVAEAAKS